MLTLTRENLSKDIEASTPKGRSSKKSSHLPAPTTWRLTCVTAEGPHVFITDAHSWLDEAIATATHLPRPPYRAEYWEPEIKQWVPTGSYAIARAIGLIKTNTSQDGWEAIAQAAGVLDEVRHG